MATKGMMVSSRSNDSALARKGMLSSNAASKVRRATPVTDRCQPRSAFTRRARPPLPQASHSCPRGDGASPRSAVARSRRERWAPLLLRPPLCRAARPARPPSRPRGRVIRAACATAWCGTPRPARARTGSRAPPPDPSPAETARTRSEEHTSELQSRGHLVCRLLLEKKKKHKNITNQPHHHQQNTNQNHTPTHT